MDHIVEIPEEEEYQDALDQLREEIENEASRGEQGLEAAAGRGTTRRGLTEEDNVARCITEAKILKNDIQYHADIANIANSRINQVLFWCLGIHGVSYITSGITNGSDCTSCVVPILRTFLLIGFLYSLIYFSRMLVMSKRLGRKLEGRAFGNLVVATINGANIQDHLDIWPRAGDTYHEKTFSTQTMVPLVFLFWFTFLVFDVYSLAVCLKRECGL